MAQNSRHSSTDTRISFTSGTSPCKAKVFSTLECFIFEIACSEERKLQPRPSLGFQFEQRNQDGQIPAQLLLLSLGISLAILFVRLSYDLLRQLRVRTRTSASGGPETSDQFGNILQRQATDFRRALIGTAYRQSITFLARVSSYYRSGEDIETLNTTPGAVWRNKKRDRSLRTAFSPLSSSSLFTSY